MMFVKQTFIAIALFAWATTALASLQSEEVDIWVNALSSELWNLGESITKFSEIRKTYTFRQAKVRDKDAQELIDDIKFNILRMMDSKMDAIRCIQQEAELRAEEFEYNDTQAIYHYYSSKFSQIRGEPPAKLPKPVKKNRAMYLNMTLNQDTHFYNIAVNTTHSSVHVPTNVYDKEDSVAMTIQWSEALDDVFVQNYNSDPALSWQYFGSPTGVMRHYPAKQWQEMRKDLFDCRVRTWFIEAATCTKDIIILFDNSGSMDGMGKHIAKLTAFSILDTFSNNDYVNVFNYSVTTNYTVPCFENMLVQATRENVGIFKEALKRLEPGGKTKLSQALEKAFDLMAYYRQLRGCEEDNKMCNQAIMVITDGIGGNLTDTISRYMNLYNGSNIPRLFTYLIGKEVTNVEEIKWLACANRGYYTHVQSLEQVTASVLKYINVIARPLVLQGKEHPVSWTHAYADLTYDDANNDQPNEPYRLLTSVAVPCFDRRPPANNESRNAYLLGVAATDVPLADFRKLTMPYRIGVNAYSFIVSNNGYVLMHPDLRPVFNGILKENYNSIDLTEVEQHDNGLPPKEIGMELNTLRTHLVEGIPNTIKNVKLKYHFNDMRRISEEYYDYFYTPLNETPFSIGIALPHTYGHYYLDVGDEIERNRHTGVNITSFFEGKWKIHPKWVYCKYRYLEGHEFKTPEKELLHFLKKMYDRSFKWEAQYGSSEEPEDLAKVECGKKTHGDDEYFCNKNLVQRLIFDAKCTKTAFEEKFTEKELMLFEKYDAFLRFVATMSGLTRWEYIFKSNFEGTREFGDLHGRAIDESWYKSAVIQHKYNNMSFVYSVPFDAGIKQNVLVTASYAIFSSDGKNETPGSVVGYQFSHSKLRERVMNISTKVSNQCHDCGKCDTNLDCYVVDSNGYILVTKNNNDTGRFFGEIEGDIMDSMLNLSIFKELILYDYQALCSYDDEGNGGGASTVLTPFKIFGLTINWLIMRLFYMLAEISLTNLLNPQYIFAQTLMPNPKFMGALDLDEANVTEEEEDYDEGPDDEGGDDEGGDDDDDEDDDTSDNNANAYFACEKQINLYILDQNLVSNNFHGEILHSNFSRPYFIKHIPKSNLIFIAINNTIRLENEIKYTTNPKKISKAPIWEIDHLNSTLLPCQKLNLNTLPRRPLQGCFNEHPLESEIVECGKASRTLSSNNLLILVLLFLGPLVYLS